MHQTTPKYHEFPLKTYDKIKYSDTDRQGHVNNALFSTFLETGRTELLYMQMPQDEEGSSFVIAGQKLDLLLEIKWPGLVEIGTAVSRIGNSSMIFFQGLYQEDKLVALAETVVVQVDNQTKKSKPLSDKKRAYLEQYLVELEG